MLEVCVLELFYRRLPKSQGASNNIFRRKIFQPEIELEGPYIAHFPEHTTRSRTDIGQGLQNGIARPNEKSLALYDTEIQAGMWRNTHGSDYQLGAQETEHEVRFNWIYSTIYIDYRDRRQPAVTHICQKLIVCGMNASVAQVYIAQ